MLASIYKETADIKGKKKSLGAPTQDYKVWSLSWYLKHPITMHLASTRNVLIPLIWTNIL